MNGFEARKKLISNNLTGRSDNAISHDTVHVSRVKVCVTNYWEFTRNMSMYGKIGMSFVPKYLYTIFSLIFKRSVEVSKKKRRKERKNGVKIVFLYYICIDSYY